MDHGRQTYTISATAPPQLAEEIHQYQPAEGEGLVVFLNRVAQAHPGAVELTIHRRAGRVAYAEIRITHAGQSKPTPVDTPGGGGV